MQRNPQANQFKKPEGFADLGWQLSCDEPVKKACRAAGHKTREFDNSLYLMRCTDVVTICDKCKYVHHIDMSD